MGTRALIQVVDGDTVIVAIRTQFDGHPSGVGHRILKAIGHLGVVNGMRGGQARDSIANGPGCLAALLVAALKREPGGVYLVPPPGETEGYLYVVRCPSFDAINEEDARASAAGKVPRGIPVQIECFGYGGKPDEEWPAVVAQWNEQNRVLAKLTPAERAALGFS